MRDLESALRSRLEAGGRAFVPYVTGGLTGVDAELLRGLEEAGADAIEVGIPFSDPVMDGPVIQEASRRALEDGATPSSVLGTIKEAGLEVPVAVMTYANPVWHAGHDAFLAACVDAGVTGVIVPDLPVDEAGDWTGACSRASVAPVFLAAPGGPDDRLRSIGETSRGFVYCVATYGVTGARDRLAETAAVLVGRLRPPRRARSWWGWGSPSPRTPPRPARSPTAWWWGARSSARCSTAIRRPPGGSPARSDRRHGPDSAPSRSPRVLPVPYIFGNPPGRRGVARDPERDRYHPDGRGERGRTAVPHLCSRTTTIVGHFRKGVG